MRLILIRAWLRHMSPPLRLEDIGAAMMSVPSPNGYTFASLMPPPAPAPPPQKPLRR